MQSRYATSSATPPATQPARRSAIGSLSKLEVVASLRLQWTRRHGWAFAALGVDEVYADVLHGNDASVRVLERCGFAPDGESSCAQRGVTQPSIRYTLRATSSR